MLPRRFAFLLLAACTTRFAAAAPAQAPAPPPAPPAGFAEAQQLVQQGRFAEAAEKLQSVTEAAPQFAAGWHLYGYALHAAGRLEEAVPAHRRAASFPATAALGSYNLACALALLGRTTESFAALEQALAAGFARWDLLAGDADLAALRADSRWRRYAGLKPDFGAPLADGPALLHAWHGEKAGDQFGWVAVGAGDVDGDGAEDVLTSAPFASPAAGAAAGLVYVFSGATGQPLHRISGAAGERLGISVTTLGDLDGDGRADFAAGTLGGECARVWSGASGQVLFEVRGEEPGAQFGREVSEAGDWNADGTPDLLLSIPEHDAGRGALEVRSGRDGSVLHRMVGEAQGDHFASALCTGGREGQRLLVVGAMDAGAGQRGRLIVYDAPSGRERFRREAAAEGVNFGRFFASVPGDCNGDGHDDVYAVDFESNAGGPNSGEVLLLSGRDGSLLHRFVGQPGDGLGIGDAIAGDVDGDGCADLLTGAWNCSDAAALGGAAFLTSGRTGRVLRSLVCRIPGATFGFDSTTIARRAGETGRDFLISAAWTAAAGPQTGSVYLFSGR